MSELRAQGVSVGIVRKGRSRVLAWAALATVVAWCPLSMLIGWIAEPVGLGSELQKALMLGLLALPVVLGFAALHAANACSELARGARVDGDSLVLGEGTDAHRYEPWRLKAGLTGLTPQQLVVVLNGGDEVQIELPPGEHPTAWLASLKLASDQRRITTTIRRAFNQIMFGMLGVPTILGGAVALANAAGRSLGDGPWWIFGLVLGAWFSWLVGAKGMGTEITIGADGVLVRRQLHSTLYRYAELDSVERTASDGASHDALVFRRKDGSEDRVWVGGDTGMSATMLHERIRDAMRTAERRGRAVVPTEALARAGRSIDEWRASLASLLSSSSADYRTVTVDRESLVRLLHDSEASVEHRIAAAMALAGSGDEGSKEQVRVAAHACASEGVRVALEAAVSDSLDESVYALATQESGVRVKV